MDKAGIKGALGQTDPAWVGDDRCEPSSHRLVALTPCQCSSSVLQTRPEFLPGCSNILSPSEKASSPEKAPSNQHTFYPLDSSPITHMWPYPMVAEVCTLNHMAWENWWTLVMQPSGSSMYRKAKVVYCAAHGRVG